MPRRSFCSHSLSSSNRKEVALKERTKERVGEANPPRKKRTRPRFLAVAQTKKTIRAEMRAPPCFFAVAILSPFFYRSGTCCYFPPPTFKKTSVRDRETMSRRSPLLLLIPPPPGPFFPFVFPDTIMVLSPVQQNIVRSKMTLVSVARIN